MFRCVRQRCHLSLQAHRHLISKQALSRIGIRYTGSAAHSQLSVKSLSRSSSRSGSIEETIRQLLSAQMRVQGGSTRASSYKEYQNNTGRVLEQSLPYEAYPSSDRRAGSRGEEVVLVLHVAEAVHDWESNYVLSSGFVIETNTPERDGKEKLVVSCAHTLEQVSDRPVPILQGRNVEPR